MYISHNKKAVKLISLGQVIFYGHHENITVDNENLYLEEGGFGHLYASGKIQIKNVIELNFPDGIIVPMKYFDAILFEDQSYYIDKTDNTGLGAFVKSMPLKTIAYDELVVSDLTNTT